ncbi:MAG: NTPase [Candidatus Bathyarchaeia archaeon]
MTGRPGVGKTTVLTKVIDELKFKGVKVGGMITKESRTNGERDGFIIYDLGSESKGWLARKKLGHGPQIGKYYVCLNDLESIGVNAILDAVATTDVVVIDEVGPMELLSVRFCNAVLRALDSNRLVLGTIHYRAAHPLIHSIRNKENAKIFEVTAINRCELPNLIAKEILKGLSENLGKMLYF